MRDNDAAIQWIEQWYAIPDMHPPGYWDTLETALSRPEPLTTAEWECVQGLVEQVLRALPAQPQAGMRDFLTALAEKTQQHAQRARAEESL